MPIINRSVRERRRLRVVELLQQGNTPKQIALRVRMGERQVLRIKKQMEPEDVRHGTIA